MSEITPTGFECKSCGCRHFFVVRTDVGFKGKLLRRRECRNCGRRITTIELPVPDQMRSKLMYGRA